MLLCALCSKNHLICQDQQCYISTLCRVPCSQNKTIFHDSKSRKCKASGDNWLLRQLKSQIDFATRCQVQKRGACSAGVEFWSRASFSFCYRVRFVLLLCTSVRYVVSQDVWALFFFFFFSLTAISLGFILLIKFLLSFLSSSNNITSVGRDVGNSFCLTEWKHRAFILAFLIGSLDLNWTVIT